MQMATEHDHLTILLVRAMGLQMLINLYHPTWALHLGLIFGFSSFANDTNMI